jgi:hypothetical protein
MKALLIKPAEQSIETTEISGKADIVKLVGYETVIADELDSNGDQLYFDEECFLRGTEGRFQIDKLIPVSGIGLIVGSNDDGSLTDVVADIENIRSRIKFQ